MRLKLVFKLGISLSHSVGDVTLKALLLHIARNSVQLSDIPDVIPAAVGTRDTLHPQESRCGEPRGTNPAQENALCKPASLHSNAQGLPGPCPTSTERF